MNATYHAGVRLIREAADDGASEYELRGGDGVPVSLVGTMVGWATSQRADHTHDGPAPPARWKCSACRWSEVSIFRDDQDDSYVVYVVGRSVIPGERDIIQLDRTDSPDAVIEILTVRRRPEPGSHESGRVFLPTQSARALAQAAAHDDPLREAYRDRAVV